MEARLQCSAMPMVSLALTEDSVHRRVGKALTHSPDTPPAAAGTATGRARWWGDQPSPVNSEHNTIS